MDNFPRFYLFAILAGIFFITALVIAVIVTSTSDRDSVLQCKCKNVNNFDEIRPRIVNGTEVLNNDLPFVVSLFIKKTNDTGKPSILFSNFCTGSIISPNFVLTAAHCLVLLDYTHKSRNYKDYFFVAGGPNHDLNYIYLHTDYYRSIKNYYKYPKFNKKLNIFNPVNFSDILHDIGLIELETPFKLGEDTGIYTACLLNHRVDDYGDSLIVAGYGGVKPEINRNQIKPKLFEARYIDDKKILGPTTKLLMTRMRHIEEVDVICKVFNFICMQNLLSAVCEGDSGGPVSWYDEESKKLYLVGISSFGASDKNATMTCLHGEISVSTSVFQYLDWIRRYVPDRERCG